MKGRLCVALLIAISVGASSISADDSKGDRELSNVAGKLIDQVQSYEHMLRRLFHLCESRMKGAPFSERKVFWPGNKVSDSVDMKSSEVFMRAAWKSDTSIAPHDVHVRFSRNGDGSMSAIEALLINDRVHKLDAAAQRLGYSSRSVAARVLQSDDLALRAKSYPWLRQIRVSFGRLRDNESGTEALGFTVTVDVSKTPNGKGSRKLISYRVASGLDPVLSLGGRVIEPANGEVVRGGAFPGRNEIAENKFKPCIIFWSEAAVETVD